jgi:hypothetical protein
LALYFQNLLGETVYVAFAWYDPSCGDANQNFRKQGWWAIQPIVTTFPLPPDWPTRFKAWDVDLRSVNRYAYFYAETANDGVNWSGNGNAWLSVNPDEAFDLCAFADPGDDQWVDFAQMDFNWVTAGFPPPIPLGWDMIVQFWNDGTFLRADFLADQEHTPWSDPTTIGGLAPPITGT